MHFLAKICTIIISFSGHSFGESGSSVANCFPNWFGFEQNLTNSKKFQNSKISHSEIKRFIDFVKWTKFSPATGVTGQCTGVLEAVFLSGVSNGLPVWHSGERVHLRLFHRGKLQIKTKPSSSRQFKLQSCLSSHSSGCQSFLDKVS